MASHAIFQYNILAIDDTHNTWTNMIVKINIPRLLGSSDDKNRRDCEEIQYTGWTDVKEKTHAGVIVQKLETEDTLTGLTDVEEKAYVGALPNEDRWKYIHRLNQRCIGQLHRFSCPERWFLEEREEVTITG